MATIYLKNKEKKFILEKSLTEKYKQEQYERGN
jgi:hypothetical protein